jgi:drug/metabolite transporter (DMT)-like permease
MFMTVILFAVYVTCSAGALLLFKHYGLEAQIETGSVLVKFHAMMLVALISYMFSFVLWLVIVSRIKLSVAMPLNFGFVNLVVLVGSVVFLREKVTPIQWAGVAVILVGIFMIAQGRETA